jgi:hypothetical protein
MAALEYDHDTIDIGFGEISTLGSMSADAMIVPALLIHPFAFRGGAMKQIFGIKISRTLEDLCQPRRLALLVYDMQVGITSQVKDGDLIVERVARTRSLPMPAALVTKTPPNDHSTAWLSPMIH